MNIRTKVLHTATELRDHLNHLNYSGLASAAAGIDDRDNAFLIALNGPYADTEDVVFDTPWASDVDRERQCEECGAMKLWPITDLSYPVAVFLRADDVIGGGE